MSAMPITTNDIVKLSGGYHSEHGVTDYDVQLANMLRASLESSRADYPKDGDIMICKGENVVYEAGHVERGNLTDHSAICVRPSIPFVFYREDGDPRFSTSGGYWFSADKNTKPAFKGQAEKTFKTWGHCGARGNGAFNFTATVNVWEIYSDSVY